eukprot:NODE_6916_length_1625_cov_14.632844.p1 GENE.NODE_6916_length_1625_cov_14.632844~~NODE_6916_length_1625_cov_14.632844.p1  ORF type:complete len:451 (+),score=126.94 NODE_6916_length_1625_cov_14.632844:75-1355(+)
MLRCKSSYAEICPISELKLVGNSLVAWPASLKNCRRVPHPQREAKPFMRDKILCKESSGHVGNVQNNLAIGSYNGKHVALFRPSDCVLDCSQGTILDFPTWKALREMLNTTKPEVTINVQMVLALAGEAEEEVKHGHADEVKVEPKPETKLEVDDEDQVVAVAPSQRRKTAVAAAADEVAPAGKRTMGATARKAHKDVSNGISAKDVKVKVPRLMKAEVDPDAWKGAELPEYPNAIRLVSRVDSEFCRQLMEEASTTSLVCYDAQWAPDFEFGADNPMALLQLAFPSSGNTYVVQLPLLEEPLPLQIQRMFESTRVQCIGFSAVDIDVHKFEITGIHVDRASLTDVQPWCECEMGENASVKQGWRVGLKRAAWCVLDFEMDKTHTTASSNWERDELTPAQVEYAAMDVWVALRMYQRLLPVFGHLK